MMHEGGTNPYGVFYLFKKRLIINNHYHCGTAISNLNSSLSNPSSMLDDASSPSTMTAP
jgi:hypothetical protein